MIYLVALETHVTFKARESILSLKRETKIKDVYFSCIPALFTFVTTLTVGNIMVYNSCHPAVILTPSGHRGNYTSCPKTLIVLSVLHRHPVVGLQITFLNIYFLFPRPGC